MIYIAEYYNDEHHDDPIVIEQFEAAYPPPVRVVRELLDRIEEADELEVHVLH